MIYVIYFQDAEVGRLTFQSGQGVEIQSIQDENLRSLVGRGIRQGVVASRDLLINLGERLKVERLVRQNEDLFPLALQSFLERHGYAMREFRNIDGELNALIQKLPDDHELKRSFSAWLQTASYLEKTYLLAKMLGDKSVT